LPKTPCVRNTTPFFALLDWTLIPERDETHPWPGSPPHPQRAYVKALLVRINERFDSGTELRAFLVKHPALVVALEFRLVLDTTQPDGLDVAHSVPSARHLRRKLQTFDHALLQRLLNDTVQTLRQESPSLGDSVALDVKHLYAWVRENNPRERIANRFDPKRQPHGDPDCKLGVKTSHNQNTAVPESPTATPVAVAPTTHAPKGETKEYLWGYGSGLSVARDASYGECVIAEHTLPFNVHDSQYYFPLMHTTRARLGRTPPRVTADAAYDAWWIYQDIHASGGTAYIALNLHGQPLPRFGAEGRHLCADHREMVGWYHYTDHTHGYRVEMEKCPILFGRVEPDATCRIQHPQFVKGVGCIKYRNLEEGARLRLLIDRTSAQFDQAYDDRTAAERINSQAKHFKIERPKLRRITSIRNQNTLIYIVINLKAIQRIRKEKAENRPP
jgi:hypothetical protein